MKRGWDEDLSLAIDDALDALDELARQERTRTRAMRRWWRKELATLEEKQRRQEGEGHGEKRGGRE